MVWVRKDLTFTWKLTVPGGNTYTQSGYPTALAAYDDLTYMGELLHAREEATFIPPDLPITTGIYSRRGRAPLPDSVGTMLQTSVLSRRQYDKLRNNPAPQNLDLPSDTCPDPTFLDPTFPFFPCGSDQFLWPFALIPGVLACDSESNQ